MKREEARRQSDLGRIVVRSGDLALRASSTRDAGCARPCVTGGRQQLLV